MRKIVCFQRMASKTSLLRLSGLIAAGLLFSTADAAYTIVDGKVIDSNYAATMSVQDHFQAGLCAMEEGDYAEAARHFSLITYHFRNTSYAQDAFYYAGISYFELADYDFADNAFSGYLKSAQNPTHFMEAIEYKFCIAEQLRLGAKCRFFGARTSPKWASGDPLALKIYDEVATALPCHELGAKALFSKGLLLWKMKDFRESVEAFRTVYRRFSKNELAPESFLMISQVYLCQCRIEFQNPDILAFAELNLRRFKQDFPREERIAEVECDLLDMREVYAKGLFDIGEFYERVGKPQAALIYYQHAIRQFPQTRIAECCRGHLFRLGLVLEDEAVQEAGSAAEEEPLEDDVEWMDE